MFDTGDSLSDENSDPPVADASPQALLHACVAAASHALDVAAAVPVETLDGAALRSLTLQLEALRTRADSTEAHTIAELDRRRHTDIRLGATTSKWLAHHAAIPAGVARARLALANRLATDLDVVDEAMRDGRIGIDHARVFAAAVNERNIEALTDLLPDLIDAAAGTVFDTWKAHVLALAELADPDGPFDPDAELLRNKLTLSGSDHFGFLRAEFTGDRFLAIHDTLQAVADELFEQFTQDANASAGALTVPPRSTLLALALEETCRRALGTDPADSRGPKVEAHLTVLAAPDGCVACGEPTAIPDHLEVWGIHHRLLGPLPASAVELLLCDATFRTTLLGSMGEPLDHGRHARHATPEQRAALEARDGGCAFPGCDAHVSWLDAHHVSYWSKDGLSDLGNFVLLCRRHHRVAHRNGWTLELTDDGWTRWTTPSGFSFWGQRHHQQRAGP